VDPRARHEEQVAELAAALAGNSQPLRVRKRTVSNLFRYGGPAARAARVVDLSRFDRPLRLDPERATLDVQGLATYRSIVDYTLPRGFVPAVAPGLKHITVAGAVAGIGIESNCARYGFAHDGLLAADVLLPDGRVVTAEPGNEHADLFHALPNSYGTLGYILRATIRLRRARPYVRLDTRRFDSVPELLDAMAAAADDPAVDHVESPIYSRTESYLTLGTQVDEPAGAVTSIYGPTIFYREISRPGRVTLTQQDYLFRYDPEWFWALPRSPLLWPFRRWAPPALRNSGLYTRILNGRLTRRLPGLRPRGDFELLIQDWEVPWRHARGLLEHALDNVDINGRPWLAGPIRSPGTATLYPVAAGELYLNLGCYASARVRPGSGPYANTRLMDAYCLAHDGIKMLYSSSFLTEDDFDRVYAGAAYRALKAKYDPAGLTPSLYEKATR
jgi:hypothetical protein